MQEKQTAYVSLETETDIIRRKNLHYATAFMSFVWILFHFTVVFFFGLELKSPMLVGVFLGFGNLIALLLDVPVGVLQRYFAPKKLYLFGVFSQLAAGLIFLKFIYISSLFTISSGGEITSVLGHFLDSFSNILLLFAAAGMYGFTKEINDITTISYILNNADPSEYSSIMSRNNIFGGVGSLLGLLVSGFVLALNPTIAVIILNIFIVILIAFIFAYFDSGSRTIQFSDIQKLKVIAKRENLEKLKEYAIGYITKADFATLAKEVTLIFIRPAALKSEKFSFAVLLPETKKEFFSIRKTIMEIPLHF